MLARNINQGEDQQEVVAALANPLGLSFNQIIVVNSEGNS